MKLMYFDYAASTPVDPRVAKKMTDCLMLDAEFGNPTSAHYFGQKAKQAIEEARMQVAELIGASSNEIIWTSGATEANNLAIKGAAQLYSRKGKHIVTLKSEHPSVLESCRYLEKNGYTISYLTPEKNGKVDIEKFCHALQPDTILATIMYVNNETGVIQNIPKIAEITSSKNILLHVDAVQAVGRIPIDLAQLPVDLMSFSAHKIYGPKGIGALYVRQKPRVRVEPQMHGGGQEQGMRSGTLATHQIVGMGAAFAIAKTEMETEQQRIKQYRDGFWKKISENKNIFSNTDFQHSVPNIVNLGVHGIKTEELIQRLQNFAISSGAACASKGIESSYVLRAMGIELEQAQCAVRISFGRMTTEAEMDLAAEALL